MGAGLTRRSAPAATLPVPAKKGTGRDICGTSGVTLCHLGDSGCSGAPGGARTAGAWVLLPWQVPWVLRSAPCAETRGERSCSCCQNTAKDLGVCSPLGVHSLLRDPRRGWMWLLAGEQAAAPAVAPRLRQGSPPAHLGSPTINFPNLRNDQLLRRTISRSQIVIVISVLILIWPNEG